MVSIDTQQYRMLVQPIKSDDDDSKKRDLIKRQANDIPYQWCVRQTLCPVDWFGFVEQFVFYFGLSLPNGRVIVASNTSWLKNWFAFLDDIALTEFVLSFLSL
jgi:hypothetical protein